MNEEKAKEKAKKLILERIGSEIGILWVILYYIAISPIDNGKKYFLCICVWNFVYNYIDGRVKNDAIEKVFNADNIAINLILSLFFPITFGFKVSKYLVSELK